MASGMPFSRYCSLGDNWIAGKTRFAFTCGIIICCDPQVVSAAAVNYVPLIVGKFPEVHFLFSYMLGFKTSQ